MNVNWKPREYHIPVASASETSSLSECEPEAEFFGDEAGLVCLPVPAFDAQDFLKGNDVGIDLAQNIDDTAWSDTSV